MNFMVGELSPSELEQDTNDIWPIPDFDYNSTDELFNWTRGLQGLGQYVLEHGPARVSVSFGALVVVPCGD